MHYLELIKLQQGHKVLYQLLQMLLLLYHFSDQVKMRLISQLIKSISRVLQESLKYFNSTIILTSFVPLASAVLPVIFRLNLNEALLSAPEELARAQASVKAGSSL